MAVATSRDSAKRPQRPPQAARGRPARNNWRWLLLFFGPAAVLLLDLPRLPDDLHDPPVASTAAAAASSPSGWVSTTTSTLFTKDPNFINLGTFPPTGAVWNNVLWIIFYTGFVLGLGLLVATLAARVRYESVIKAIVFLPMAIAATALAVIWKFVYAPDANIGLLNAVLGIVNLGPISWLGDVSVVNWRADRRRDLGLGRASPR